MSEMTIAALDRSYRDRLRSLLALYDLVERVVAALEETGALGTTYLVFTSDNRYHLGDHRQAHGKGSPYEAATHVPLLVMGPEVPAGRVEDRLTVNTYLAPTFAELAGVDAPAFVDGRSLAPLLRGDDVPWRRAILTQKPRFVELVTEDQTFTVYANGEREPYDLDVDPYQLENRANDRGRKAEVEALDEWLTALAACAGASCVALENGPP